jgi:large subunit ribosomal protein L4
MVSALSAKAAEGEVAVIDALELNEVKTKSIAALLNAIGAKKALVLTNEKNENVYLSTRNIKGAKASFVGMLNVYDILNSDVLVAGKDAVEKLGEVYA